MSLTVYQSKFVLVGGRHPSTGEPTNIVLTSTTGQQWEPSLPPMPTKRYATSSVSTRSSPEVLVVAGGMESRNKLLDVVEVFIRDEWTTVDPLPEPDCKIHSTLHDGSLHFVGGVNNTSYTCSCDSLVSSCEKSSSHTSNRRRLWRESRTPGNRTTAISYDSRLVNIDGCGTVRCYSSTHESWIETTSEGNRPRKFSLSIAAIVLATKDIIYAHYFSGIFRVTVLGKHVCVYMCTCVYVCVYVYVHVY